MNPDRGPNPQPVIQFVVSDGTIWAGLQIPPCPPLAKGGNFRIVSIVTPDRIIRVPI